MGTGTRLHSRSKFGIIATSIIKETRFFIFRNFNVAKQSTDEHGQPINSYVSFPFLAAVMFTLTYVICLLIPLDCHNRDITYE